MGPRGVGSAVRSFGGHLTACALGGVWCLIAVLARAVDCRAELVEAVQKAGYRYVTLDLEGFRSGNLNEGLTTARETR